jgi:hypothetical protein
MLKRSFLLGCHRSERAAINSTGPAEGEYADAVVERAELAVDPVEARELDLVTAHEVVAPQELVLVDDDGVTARAGEVQRHLDAPQHVEVVRRQVVHHRLVHAPPRPGGVHRPHAGTPSTPSCGSMLELSSSRMSNAHSRRRPPADPRDRHTRPLESSASGGSRTTDVRPRNGRGTGTASRSTCRRGSPGRRRRRRAATCPTCPSGTRRSPRAGDGDERGRGAPR